MQNIQRTLKNNKKTNTPVKKWAKGMNRHLIKKIYTQDKQAYEEMLYVIYH